LVRDCCGLRNPESGNAVAIGEIDMVVVPGLGFDRKGNRLGRGGAYYDRFFSNENLHAVRCGLAYHKQLVDKVPVTERDQTVDMVVTDAEVLYFNGTKGDSNGQVCQ
jgi:5-formyltetrahydrofolate cyclo-ligase